MGTLVDQLAGLKASTIARNTRRSQDWLINKIKKGSIDKKYLTTQPKIGMMYHFVYFPKWEKTLPYWDRNPLVIPIEPYKDGFLGLNLHYLPPKMRLIFLDKLMPLASDMENGMDEKTKMRISYDLLKNSLRYKEFKPTIKRYLFKQVKSKFALVPADDWQFAVFLPTARFVKAPNTEVYKQSRASI